MAYLHGTFKDRKNNTIEVQIRNAVGSGNIVIGEDHSSKVFFSDDPIEISCQIDDMFEPIIKKSCTINLLTSIYLGDKVFAGNDEDVTVKVFWNGELVFSGYVEPNSYTQPYANHYEEFTLNCIDYLSTLQYKSPLDTSSYSGLVADGDIYTFTEYLERMGFDAQGSVFYDMSKKVNGESALDKCGVSVQAFLGDGEDDVMNYEDILKELLQYLNLHIIQEGNRFYIFDWKSIEGNNVTWTNVLGNEIPLVASADISVTKDDYSSDATTLSMSEIYNQIQVKCNLEEVEDILTSPLDTDALDSHYSRSQLFMTEFYTLGTGQSARTAFKNLVLSPMANDPESTESQTDYDAWNVKDWYVKWLYNPNWKLTYKNTDVESMMNNISGNYVDQYLVMKYLREKNYFPALVTLSSQKNNISISNLNRTNSKLNSDNYLVISVNGEYDDTDAGATSIDNDNQAASGTSGLLTYNSGTSTVFSPTSDGITNYMVFNGKICLAPLIRKTKHYSNASQEKDVTFNAICTDIRNASGFDSSSFSTVPLKDSEDGGYYAQEFWKTSRQDAKPQPQLDELWMYPYMESDRYKEYQYNYSSDGSTSDTYNKIPILECQMKIGDKYLVENTYNLNGGKPTYQWLTYDQCPYLKDDNGNNTSTKKTTFTLGFDPNIGDYILGNTYELANTVDGRISNEEGTAIPIRNSDALSGRVEFKILGVVNVAWNNITRRHPTLFRHTQWYDNYVNLLQHTSAIWIKDFNVKVISDNGGNDVKSQSKDLIYLSDEQHTYIKKRDDIEFHINTMPTVQEAVDLGVKTTISYTNVINMNTNLALTNITQGNTTDRPERIYIDQYWNYYNSPKVILETDLHNSGYNIFNTFNFGGFGKMIPLGITQNLKSNNVHLICRQL